MKTYQKYSKQMPGDESVWKLSTKSKPQEEVLGEV